MSSSRTCGRADGRDAAAIPGAGFARRVDRIGRREGRVRVIARRMGTLRSPRRRSLRFLERVANRGGKARLFRERGEIAREGRRDASAPVLRPSAPRGEDGAARRHARRRARPPCPGCDGRRATTRRSARRWRPWLVAPRRLDGHALRAGAAPRRRRRCRRPTRPGGRASPPATAAGPRRNAPGRRLGRRQARRLRWRRGSWPGDGRAARRRRGRSERRCRAARRDRRGPARSMIAPLAPAARACRRRSWRSRNRARDRPGRDRARRCWHRGSRRRLHLAGAKDAERPAPLGPDGVLPALAAGRAGDHDAHAVSEAQGGQQTAMLVVRVSARVHVGEDALQAARAPAEGAAGRGRPAAGRCARGP